MRLRFTQQRAVLLCVFGAAFSCLMLFAGDAFAYRQDYTPENAPQYKICPPNGACEVAKLVFIVVDPHWYVYSFSNGVQWTLSLDDESKTEISSATESCVGGDCKGWTFEEVDRRKPDAINITELFSAADKLAQSKSGTFLYGMALSYYNDKNYIESFKYFAAVGKLGDPEGWLYIGHMYRFGRGVEADLEEAVRWYKQAANQGCVSAQLNLGVCYAEGVGVKPDYVQAYKWLALAKRQGNFKANQALKNLQVAMSPAQVAEGQRLTKEWQK